MDITRTHNHGRSVSTTIPVYIVRALGLHVTDHVAWTFNTKGYAEMRRVPSAHELAAPRKRRP